MTQTPGVFALCVARNPESGVRMTVNLLPLLAVTETPLRLSLSHSEPAVPVPVLPLVDSQTYFPPGARTVKPVPEVVSVRLPALLPGETVPAIVMFLLLAGAIVPD